MEFEINSKKNSRPHLRCVHEANFIQNICYYRFFEMWILIQMHIIRYLKKQTFTSCRIAPRMPLPFRIPVCPWLLFSVLFLLLPPKVFQKTTKISKVISFSGGPSTGKAEVCHLVAQRLGYTHLSMAELLRKEAEVTDTLRGRRCRMNIEAGLLCDSVSIQRGMSHDHEITCTSALDLWMWYIAAWFPIAKSLCS